MLWSGWTLEAKLLIVIGCAIVIAISILIIVCLIIPETWWSCPWTSTYTFSFIAKPSD